MPSKKVSAVLLGTVIVVTAIVLINSQEENFVPTPTTEVSLSVPVNLQSDATQDADADGLLDWEESLWGTDINEPDTDKDGTTDGAEVDADRNPLVVGPDDSNYEIEEKLLADLEKKWPETTGLTKEISSDLISSYFSLRSQTGGALSLEQKTNLIENVTDSALGRYTFRNRYNKDSLVTFDGATDKDKLLSYANALIEGEDRLKMASTQIGPEDYSELSTATTQMAEYLIGLETPEQLVSYQAALANNYYNIGSAIVLMAQENADPALALVGLTLFSQSSASAAENLAIMFQYIRNNGIIFNGEDFVWTD